MSILMKAVHCSRWLPKVTASLMKGKNFSLFSIYLGANMAPPAILPTSLARSMIFAIKEARIAGMKIALLIDGLRRGIGALEIRLHQPRRAHQHFAVVSNLHLHPLHGAPDRIELDIARRLHAHRHAGFRHAVQLLEIDAE